LCGYMSRAMEKKGGGGERERERRNVNILESEK
jgi:hypothetical protein